MFQSFFEWLFDDNRIKDKSITLFDEVDLSLASSYSDCNIYYPKQIKDFFETSAMKRLGRIGQLGSATSVYPNSYHTRLEHSKGVYNRKLEEFFYKFQEPEWKEYIETHNLKLYLIAELIKMGGHDIGHLPRSHAFEDQVCHKRGIHEIIGQRLMLENKEIQDVYNSISPCLTDIMHELYEKNILNFKEHDESSFDVDRLDFLNRDGLYLGFKTELPTLNYKSVCVNVDDNDIPIENPDQSISLNNNGKKFIDVYDFSSLPIIEKALSFRDFRYKNVYVQKNNQAFEGGISNFVQAFLSSKSECGSYLRKYLQVLQTQKVENLDLEDFMNFDDITLYSELLDIAEHHENANVRDLSTLLIPSMSTFLTSLYSYLGIYNKTQTYSEYDKNFLRRIKGLIQSDNPLSNKLRDENYISNNIIFLPEDTPFLDSTEKQLITTYDWSICSYKKKEPIYVASESGKVFELSKHPNRQYNWDTKKIPIHYSYVYIPYLRFNGVSEDLIQRLQLFYGENSCNIEKEKAHPDVNMQPLQVGHNIEDCFLEL